MAWTVPRGGVLSCLAALMLAGCDRPAHDMQAGNASSTASPFPECTTSLTGRHIALRRGALTVSGGVVPPALDFHANEYALTIDGGPNGDTLPGLLALLRKNCVKATFFLNGRKALAEKSLVASILRDGHTLGSLTWNAASATGTGDEQTALRRGAGAVEAGAWNRDIAAGQPRLIRLPLIANPAMTADLAAFLRRQNFILANVDADPEDWRNQPARVSLRRMLESFPDRGVIRIHDGPPNSEALLRLIFSLLDERKAKIVAIDIPGQDMPAYRQ